MSSVRKGLRFVPGNDLDQDQVDLITDRLFAALDVEPGTMREMVSAVSTLHASLIETTIPDGVSVQDRISEVSRFLFKLVMQTIVARRAAT